MNSGSAQAAMFHAHPAMWAAMPLAFVVVLISLVILVRWQMSKKAWPYHPGGASGFLKDEVLRYASIWLPFAIVMVGARYYVYRFHPEFIQSPYFYAMFLSIIVFRRLAGFLPHVREIGARIDSARMQAKAAALGVAT